MCLLYHTTSYIVFFFFFNDTATTEIYTYSFPTRRSSDLIVARALQHRIDAPIPRIGGDIAAVLGEIGAHGEIDVELFAVGDRLGRVLITVAVDQIARSEEHTSELQSLMRISYAVFCLKKQTKDNLIPNRSYRYKIQTLTRK